MGSVHKVSVGGNYKPDDVTVDTNTASLWGSDHFYHDDRMDEWIQIVMQEWIFALS